MQPTEIRTYAELIAAIRARIFELNTTYLGVDMVGGLATGHCGKVLAGKKMLGNVSLGVLLATLGIKLVMVVDEPALEAVRGKLVRRKIAVPARYRVGPPAPDGKPRSRGRAGLGGAI
jgi:hypothetical protein